METELTFTDQQIERLDTIDNTIYQALLILLEKTPDELPWNMEVIEDVTEAISKVCESKGYHMRWPAIVTDKHGRKTYEE